MLILSLCPAAVSRMDPPMNECLHHRSRSQTQLVNPQRPIEGFARVQAEATHLIGRVPSDQHGAWKEDSMKAWTRQNGGSFRRAQVVRKELSNTPIHKIEGGVGGQRVELGSKFARSPLVVGVKVGDEIAPGGGDSYIAGRSDTLARLGQELDLGVSFDDLLRRI